MPLNFDVELAMRAGLIGGSAVIILLMVARQMKLGTANYFLLLGSVITQSDDSGAEMLGFLLHMGLSVVGALAYASVFTLWHASGWWRGIVVSLPHLALTVLILGAIALRLPALRARIWPHHLTDQHHHPVYNAIMFATLHVVYGTCVGMFFPVP